MIDHKRALAVAVCAGLAVSAAARAQFTIVDNLPGSFTDISGTGTPLSTGDDDSEAFFSSVTNALVTNPNLYASTNGNITDVEFATWSNGALPAGGVGFGLFPFWDDLYEDGYVYYQTVQENGINVQVIQWVDVGLLIGTVDTTFEVKIFESGPVYAQFLYQDADALDNGASATVGFQTGGGSEMYSLNQPNITSGMVLSVVQGVTGACCLPDGSCAELTANGCSGQGGIYRGDNSACGTANCVATQWDEQGDAGSLPADAQVVSGSGPLTRINGMIDSGDSDMYRIQICDPSNFRASAVNSATTIDTQLFLFDSTGHGVSFDDDDPSGSGLQSVLTGQFVPGPGEYFLAISTYNNDPHGADTGDLIWANTPFNVERRPDGPSAAEAVGSWDGGSSASGGYQINFAGACFVGGNPPPGCYANCDLSTTVPFLNVNDFICFQTKFAAGDSYANCDLSTQPPVLNVNDFICFQTKFAAGCSAP